MCRHNNNRAVNNFNVLMVLLCLAFFWSSQYNIFRWKESGSMSLNNSDKPVEHYECPLTVSKFASASLIGYSSPPTRVSPIAGLQYLLEYQTLVLFVKLNFWFEFETVTQPGFEPGSQGPKAAMLTIELHSIDKCFSYLFS